MIVTERGVEARGLTDDALVSSAWWRLLGRFVAVLIVMLVVAAAAAHWLRPTAESAALSFVERFGVGGMAFGTLLADGVHFPVPPQFYMLLAIASHTPAWKAFTAIAAGSVLAGAVGYAISERLSRIAWISRRTIRLRRVVTASFERHGYAAALLLSMLPVPFSVLCYLAGLNRLPHKFLALLALLRVPKLAVFYLLLQVGWSVS